VKTFRIILLTTACVGLGLPASRADFVTVGTPNGGTRDPLLNPGTSRFQQVYSASVFGDVPILITVVAFVSNAHSSFSTLVPDLAQDVSTATALGSSGDTIPNSSELGMVSPELRRARPLSRWAHELHLTYLVENCSKPSRLVTSRWVGAMAAPAVQRERYGTTHGLVFFMRHRIRDRGFSPRPGRKGSIWLLTRMALG